MMASLRKSFALRIHKNIGNGKTKVQIVESVYEGKKVHQKVLRHIITATAGDNHIPKWQ